MTPVRRYRCRWMNGLRGPRRVGLRAARASARGSGLALVDVLRRLPHARVMERAGGDVVVLAVQVRVDTRDGQLQTRGVGAPPRDACACRATSSCRVRRGCRCSAKGSACATPGTRRARPIRRRRPCGHFRRAPGPCRSCACRNDASSTSTVPTSGATGAPIPSLITGGGA